MNIHASVGILTFNSAHTLRRALESVRDFDDIVICDGGSTDETLAIAREFGARVISQDARFKNPDGTLCDYSGVRNQCLDAAQHDWFLYIDSDETISSGLREDIRRIVDEPHSPLAYRVPIGIIMDGHRITYSSNYPGYQFRFFNKKSGARFIKTVHERIEFDAKKIIVGTLSNHWYVHTTRADWNNYVRDNARYRRMEVAQHCKHTPLGAFLFYVAPRHLKTFFGVSLRALRIYSLHGFSNSIPPRGELGRALNPLLFIAGVLRCKMSKK